MPLLSTLAAVATIIGAGTSAGLSIDQAVTAPGAPKPVAPTAPAGPTPQQQQQTQAAQAAAVGQAAPAIEGLTSGFANPGYYAQQGALSAGVAGQPGGDASATRAIEQAFGLPPGSIAGGGSGGPSTPAKPFTPSGVGDPSVGAFPTSTTDLSSYVNTFFKG
jgi:hypothetical protein